MARRRLSNKYCSLSNLRNESDVEQTFIRPLLEDLGYTEDLLKTKTTLSEMNIGKKRSPRLYKPDFICFLDKKHLKPVLIVDAKHPDDDAKDGLADAQLYASVLRRGLDAPKPEQFCIGSNGANTIVKHHDSNEIIHDLDFLDFQSDDLLYMVFKKRLSHTSLAERFKNKSAEQEPFEFQKPPIPALLAIFEACHNLIWRREKCPPSEAFYEFAKILFVKLRKDRDLHPKATKGPLSADDVEVSVRWIERLEPSDPNPFDSVLFANLRNGLEEEIQQGIKKRMFDKGEGIKLKPNTIKEVVRLPQHHDLYAIDEDLNGRMFETFLTAVIRGRSLGQFFTPRTVVKFMVDIASLTISRKTIPKVLDACCGTGGFLIEALARLTDGISRRSGLSASEKDELLETLRMESLWGIEANETIARIARINMYLHQDGGSRIYKADALDKELATDENMTGEPKKDIDELRRSLLKDELAFDVVLTNPPFAMRYEAKKADEKKILEQYVLARSGKKKGLVASLRSSIMFLERYYDLLREGGLLLTVIDDSALNTSTTARLRKWLKEHFLVRAIVSLPKNTFVVAGSGSKTSILVLEKKKEVSGDQADVFMAKSLNVGHTSSGKPDLKSNDLPAILAEWTRFRDNGTPPAHGGCFVVESGRLEDRLDPQWYDPQYLQLYECLRAVRYDSIRDLKVNLRYGLSVDSDYLSDVPFLRIENLRRNDIDLSDLKYVPSAVYQNQLKAAYLKEGDILIARSGTYVGLCAAVGTGMEGYVYGSYIIRLRLPDRKKILPKFLSLYLNSRFGQMQFDRVKTGSLQFNINQEQIGSILVPAIPIKQQEKIIAEFFDRLSEIKRTKQVLAGMEADFSNNLVSRVTTTAKIKGKLRLRDFTGE